MTSSRALVRAIPITIVLAIVAGGLVLIALAHWRRGTVALGVAMLLAGLLRLLLSDRVIGVLAVRGKVFDVGFYALTGVAMMVLAIGLH